MAAAMTMAGCKPESGAIPKLFLILVLFLSTRINPEYSTVRRDVETGTN